MSLSRFVPAELLTSADARQALSSHKRHYVYILCRSDGSPFYVGKGVQLRCFFHEAEARNSERLTHKLNLLRAMSARGEAVRYCVESSFAEEATALERERELISLIGRHDLGLGPLTNQTSGGEGSSDPSEESRERRRQTLWGDADSEDRRIANRFFQKLCSVRSVPIKPVPPFKPERLRPNRPEFAMSIRQAAALTASALANRVLLEPGALIPRKLKVEQVTMAIENGVARDILSSGMAMLAKSEVGDELLSLTDAGHAYVISTMDRALLVDAGILHPVL